MVSPENEALGSGIRRINFILRQCLYVNNPKVISDLLQMRIGFPSTLTHEMVGGGLPLARQLSMMRMPSLASVSELLSSSKISGGTAGKKTREK